jgi:hypothetical protein
LLAPSSQLSSPYDVAYTRIALLKTPDIVAKHFFLLAWLSGLALTWRSRSASKTFGDVVAIFGLSDTVSCHSPSGSINA